MTEPESQETRPDTDLRDHLHQMEAKVRKLRDARNNHNEQGKRFAEQRNAIQAQYKEHREKLDMSVAEVKAIRAEQKSSQEEKRCYSGTNPGFNRTGQGSARRQKRQEVRIFRIQQVGK